MAAQYVRRSKNTKGCHPKKAMKTYLGAQGAITTKSTKIGFDQATEKKTGGGNIADASGTGTLT